MGLKMKSQLKPRTFVTRVLAVGAIIALGFGMISTSAQAVESPLSMGTASTYGVLASAAITSATPSTVTGTAGGDIGVGGATAHTGSITYSGTEVLGGSSLTALTAASGALADNRGGTSTVTELGGRTLIPGAYTNGTLGITGTLTLDGGGASNSVFIFRAASTLITAVGSSVVLTNGAQACNVFWQVGSSATLGASSTMVGHVIAQASISTGASSNVNGQLIGITGAVTLGGTTIVNNSCSTPTPTATPAASSTPEAPQQLSVITSCTDTTNLSTVGGNYTVTGTFNPLVTQVSVDGVMIAKSLWTATTSQVSITMPAHAPGKARVVLYDSRVGELNPVCSVNYVAPPGTLHIIKKVVNSFGGMLTDSSFTIHVTLNGKDVAGSPSASAGSMGKAYILPPGDYVLTEDRVAGYRGIWSGPISTGGKITVKSDEDITVTRTNFDTSSGTPSPAATDSTTATETPTATETGGELPQTSSGFGNWLLVAGGVIVLGGIGFATRKYISNK
jgi:hypothetical protein